MADKKDSQMERLVDEALEEFKNDLWINRRLGLEEVIEKLKNVNFKNKPNDKQQNLCCQEWTSFVEFLRDQCNGQLINNSDQQWGQLMNLMGVSRKLNHRSAKFKDIIKSKLIIEANAKEIRDFNHIVKLSNSIEKSLKDLHKDLESRELTLTSINDKKEVEGQDLGVAGINDSTSKLQLQLKHACEPMIRNLNSQLSSDLITRKLKSDGEKWQQELDVLSRIYERLNQFLTHYLELKKNLTQLEPLVVNFESVKIDAYQDGGEINNDRADLLQVSLSSCKHKFKKILDFDRSLDTSLRTLVGSKIRDKTPIDQQVVALKLTLILNSKYDFKSDLYSSGLERALSSLLECRTILDEIMRNLRLEYGRFYFLNDIELLKIISCDVRLVSEYQLNNDTNRRLISKIFNTSIRGFILQQVNGQQHIAGVLNSIAEQIMLTSNELVPLKKRVNIYSLEIVRIFNEVLRKLRRSLKQMLRVTIETAMSCGKFELRSPSDDISWELPIQLIELMEKIKFTHRVEKLVGGHQDSLNLLVDFYQKRLVSMKQLSAINLKEQNQEKNKKLADLKISVGLSLTVHFLSLLTNLRPNKAAAHEIVDWNWQKLPRYYVSFNSDQDDEWNVEIKLAGARFLYRFDLLPIEILMSNHQVVVKQQSNDCPLDRQVEIKRLITTQVTERCYLVATQAVSLLKLGVSPFGPAGSGKTETIKALGHMLGSQVIVHNCDETNDSQSLEQLIWGMAHTGLWGCFDEFNRLSSETLSSVSAILELVQNSLRLEKYNIDLADGQTKSIDQDSAFFVTLNPGDASKYAGRRRLPTNLRALFLPVAMVQVEIGSIVKETLLTFRGDHQTFESMELLNVETVSQLGDQIAKWIVCMKSIHLEEPSNRCEWDLRLVMAIIKRFKYKLMTSSRSSSHNLNSCASTEQTMVDAIRCEVEPRLNGAEVSLLHRGICDAFNLENLSSNYIKSANEDNDDDRAPSQLRLQLELRSGVILLGPTNSGKSHTWRRALSRANTERHDSIRAFELNPRSYDRDYIFGYFDGLTKKWTDGILTKLVRDSLRILQNEPKVQQIWLVLDGPIDPDWIESLNSVLDDNQVLTLSSGERLSFLVSPDKCIKLLIETDNIDYASPATISRLGLVYHAQSLDRLGDSKLDQNNLIIMAHNGDIQQSHELAYRHSQEARCIEYNCNEFSSCRHLLEILSDHHDTCNFHIINNLDLIQAEDKWSTRSFIELLRFVITYRYFYSHSDQLSRVPIGPEVKFIITTEHLEGLKDKRLSSLGRVLKSESSVNTNDQSKGYKSLDVFLENELISNKSQAIQISLLESDNISLITTNTINWFSSNLDAKTYKLYRFNNRDTQLHSLDKLFKVLADGVAANQHASTVIVFLINSFELAVMDVDMKRQLYHVVNKLQIMQTSSIKFLVYYNHTKQEPDQELDRRFWISWGRFQGITQVIDIKEQLESGLEKGTTKSSCVDELAKSLNTILEPYQGFISTTTIKCSLITHLIDTILTIREDVANRRRLLINLLKQVDTFEAYVSEIKANRQSESLALERKKSEIECLMRDIDKEMSEYEIKRTKSESMRREQEIKSKQISGQSETIERELSQVKPLIEENKRELGRCLKPEALNEIKTLRQPPKTIKDILDVVLLLLGIGDTSWTSIKTFLNKYSLRDELTSYDFHKRLTPALLERVEQEIDQRHDSFQLQQARRASLAVVPILNWVEASVQYGRVLTKVKPLNDQLDRLKLESSQVGDCLKDLDEQIAQVDIKVKSETRKLEALKKSYLQANETACRVSADLDRAQLIVTDLHQQTSRWRAQLENCEKLSSDSQVFPLALVCSSVTLLSRDLNDVARILSNSTTGRQITTAKPCDILTIYLRDFYNPLMDTMDQETLDLASLINENSDQTQLLQLLNLKLLLSFKRNPLIPFVIIDKSMAQKSSLMELITSKNVLCSADNLIILKPFGEDLIDWRQSLEMALSVDKIVMIEINLNDSESIALTGDILDYAQTKSNIILYSHLDQDDYYHDRVSIRQTILSMSRLLELTASKQSIRDSQTGHTPVGEAEISTILMRRFDWKLCDKMRQNELELAKVRREAKQLETKFIKQLALHRSTTPVGGDGSLLQNDLVRNLSDLKQSRDSLDASAANLESKLAQYHESKSRFSSFAKRAALFYENFVANLQQIDMFYHLSKNRYIELLLANSSELTPQMLTTLGLENLKSIVTATVSCLRYEHKETYRQHLFASLASGFELSSILGSFDLDKAQEILVKAFERAANLGQSLIECVNQSSQRSNNVKLAILMHNSMRPSPQVLVDELFKNSSNFSNIDQCQYFKLYATSDLAKSTKPEFQSKCGTTKLEKQLVNILSDANQQARSQLKCVCIANAHLAPRWMNTKLVELIKANSQAEGVKFLLILIAESDVELDMNKQTRESLFDSKLLDCADLKYWYDELTLSLADRFGLYHKLTLATLPDGDSSLIEDLVMFHVICQELTKLTIAWKSLESNSSDNNNNKIDDKRPPNLCCWSRNDYNFDYEQLLLAMKTLKQTAGGCSSRRSSTNSTVEDESFRELFYNLLNSIVYGSRVETRQDEQLLECLLKRFISPNSSKQSRGRLLQGFKSLARYEPYCSTTATVANDSENQSMNKLATTAAKAKLEKYTLEVNSLIGIENDSRGCKV